MARYQIKMAVNGNNIKSVQKKLAEQFPEAVVQVEKVNDSPSRADRLAEAEGDFENAKSIVSELKEEMENWRDSLPENLQSSDKASQIEEAISNLEEIESNMDQCEFGNVEFPGMMG